jgi:hypothetical protein
LSPPADGVSRRVIRGLSAGCENGGDRVDRDVVVFLRSRRREPARIFISKGFSMGRAQQRRMAQMTTREFTGPDDDRIRPAAPHRKLAIAPEASPHATAGMRAAIEIIKTFAVLILLATGALAACLLLSLSRSLVH